MSSGRQKKPQILAKVINEITQRHGFSGNLVFLDTMCFKSFCGPAILRCCFLSQDLGSLVFVEMYSQSYIIFWSRDNDVNVVDVRCSKSTLHCNILIQLVR